MPNFPCLVHKLSVILNNLDYKPQWKMGVKYIQAEAYNGARTVVYAILIHAQSQSSLSQRMKLGVRSYIFWEIKEVLMKSLNQFD